MRVNKTGFAGMPRQSNATPRWRGSPKRSTAMPRLIRKFGNLGLRFALAWVPTPKRALLRLGVEHQICHKWAVSSFHQKFSNQNQRKAK